MEPRLLTVVVDIDTELEVGFVTWPPTPDEVDGQNTWAVVLWCEDDTVIEGLARAKNVAFRIGDVCFDGLAGVAVPTIREYSEAYPAILHFRDPYEIGKEVDWDSLLVSLDD